MMHRPFLNISGLNMPGLKKTGMVLGLCGAFALHAGCNGVAAPQEADIVAPVDAAARWQVEYEEQMRTDTRALINLIGGEIGAMTAGQEEVDAALARLSPLAAVLEQCGGRTANLADYAWALNHVLDESVIFFTALEVMKETEEHFPRPGTEARQQDITAAMDRLTAGYEEAARWLWPMNAAFAKAYPGAANRAHGITEEGPQTQGDRAGADYYSRTFPFAVTVPVSPRAPVFGPYASTGQPGPAPACR